MKTNNISPCIVTNRVDESREFYTKHFGATITFDCGWYINLQFANDASQLQFIAPQSPEQTVFGGSGLMYNLSVEDVDKEYERLSSEGLPAVMPLENHPWGDRGFAIQDPNGIILYIFTDIEPEEEFKQYYK